MGMITITKKKVSTLPALSAITLEIDAYGDALETAAPIQAEIKRLTAKLKPLKEAETALDTAILSLDLDDDVEGHMERGAAYEIEIGKRGSKREIKDLEKAKKLLGNELFMKIAKITLKDLDDYLTPPERDMVLTTNRTAHGVKLAKRA